MNMFTAPSSEEKDRRESYIVNAFQKISGAINRASDYHSGFDVSKTKQMKRDMLKHMEYWFFETMLRDVEGWDDNVRFVDAILRAIENNTVVFDDFKDVAPLDLLFFLRLHYFPSVIEHFAERGELVDVLGSLRESAIDSVDKNLNALIEGTEVPTVSQIKLLRLYRYDRTRKHEKQNESVGSAESDVPLEIRLQFSGFHDPVTDEEVRNFSELVDVD